MTEIRRSTAKKIESDNQPLTVNQEREAAGLPPLNVDPSEPQFIYESIGRNLLDAELNRPVEAVLNALPKVGEAMSAAFDPQANERSYNSTVQYFTPEQMKLMEDELAYRAAQTLDRMLTRRERFKLWLQQFDPGFTFTPKFWAFCLWCGLHPIDKYWSAGIQLGPFSVAVEKN